MTYISWSSDFVLSLRLFSNLNYFPISACSGLLKFDIKMLVNVAMLDLGQLFTESTRRGHPCTLDTLLVLKGATNGESDKAFLLTSKFCPLGAVCPCSGAKHMYKSIQKNICIKSDFKEISLYLLQNGVLGVYCFQHVRDSKI